MPRTQAVNSTHVAGWNLRNGPCAGCPHPQRGVQRKRHCVKLCSQHAGCTGWVFNSLGECFIKGGPLEWHMEKWTGGTTWASEAECRAAWGESSLHPRLKINCAQCLLDPRSEGQVRPRSAPPEPE